MKRAVSLLFAVSAVCMCLLFSCENPYAAKGMFSEISQEIKLRDPTVKGNILQMMQVGDDADPWIYAVGGNIHRKKVGEGRSWERFRLEGLPGKAQVRRLAAGYSNGKEYLYALRMWMDDWDDDKFYMTLYWTDPNDKDDKWHEYRWDGNAYGSISDRAPLFSNQAKKQADRNAYIVTDKGVYKLSCDGNVVTLEPVTGNGAGEGTLSAARSNGSDYFSNSLAFCSNADETMLYEVKEGAVWYGADNNRTKSEAGFSNNAKSLFYHAGENKLYAGLGGGDTGLQRIKLNAAGTPEGAEGIGGNTDAALGSYDVYCVYVENTPAPGKKAATYTVYASSMSRGTALSSKRNGLWGLYTDPATGASDLGKWNRE